MKSVAKERLQSLIREKLALIIEKEMNDNALHRISLTEVLLSGDERSAVVYYDVSGDKETIESVQEKLNKLRKYIGSRLGKTIKMRRSPDLSFKRDNRMEIEDHIEEIIRGDR